MELKAEIRSMKTQLKKMEDRLTDVLVASNDNDEIRIDEIPISTMEKLSEFENSINEEIEKSWLAKYSFQVFVINLETLA